MKAASDVINQFRKAASTYGNGIRSAIPKAAGESRKQPREIVKPHWLSEICSNWY
jgi:hypothetical protein